MEKGENLLQFKRKKQLKYDWTFSILFRKRWEKVERQTTEYYDEQTQSRSLLLANFTELELERAISDSVFS